MITKKTKILALLYVISLIFAFFYVRNALQEGTIEVEQVKEEEDAFEVKPAKVTLVIYYPDHTETYTKRLKNTDTVQAFLEELRKEDNLYFEIVSYIDGIEIVDINKSEISDLDLWRVFYNEADITNDLKDIKLVDAAIYELRLVHR